MLLDFKSKYDLRPAHLARIFGFVHANAWVAITKIDTKRRKKDEDTEVDATLGVIYWLYIDNPGAIEKVKNDNFDIGATYDNLNRYLGTTKKSDKIATGVFSKILGKKENFYDRVTTRGDKQTLTVKTLATMLDEAIKSKDHEQVFKIIESGKREALARGDTFEAEEYDKILRKKTLINSQNTKRGKKTI